jgi:hypothetical protein
LTCHADERFSISCKTFGLPFKENGCYLFPVCRFPFVVSTPLFSLLYRGFHGLLNTGFQGLENKNLSFSF